MNCPCSYKDTQTSTAEFVVIKSLVADILYGLDIFFDLFGFNSPNLHVLKAKPTNP
jgi:hypothetical protein